MDKTAEQLINDVLDICDANDTTMNNIMNDFKCGNTNSAMSGLKDIVQNSISAKHLADDATLKLKLLSDHYKTS